VAADVAGPASNENVSGFSGQWRNT
jgi:hypothetical protein